MLKHVPLISLYAATLLSTPHSSPCAVQNGSAHPYLPGQHLATSQAHRLYMWIHPEQIHSPCKQCKSSSSSLLLSWSPVMENPSSATIIRKTTEKPPPTPANRYDLHCLKYDRIPVYSTFQTTRKHKAWLCICILKFVLRSSRIISRDNSILFWGHSAELKVQNHFPFGKEAWWVLYFQSNLRRGIIWEMVQVRTSRSAHT